MASESTAMSRILGNELPNIKNWRNENWLVALFGLSTNGVEFHIFHSWTREVAGYPLGKDMDHSPTVLQEVYESSAWGVSRILGATLPTSENWLDSRWVEALFGLPTRGIQFSAFKSWSRHVASGRKICLLEALPKLFVNTEKLKFRSRELREFIEELDRTRFSEKDYLEDIKAHLEKHKLVYWKTLDVTITIQGSALGNRVPDRVRVFYDSKPSVHGCDCVVQEGFNGKVWVMRCGSAVGEHRTKKVARMISIIKEHIDPSFHLEGNSPPPSPHQEDRKRKRTQTMNMATSTV